MGSVRMEWEWGYSRITAESMLTRFHKLYGFYPSTVSVANYHNKSVSELSNASYVSFLKC